MRLTRTIVVGVIAAAVLSGCAIGAEPEPTPSPEQPFALAISDEAVLEALGPLPADEEFTPEQQNDFVQRSAEFHWTNVARGYPDAVRPEVVEIDRTTGGNPAALACQQASTGTPQEVAIAVYVCARQHVTIPDGTLSERQVAYLYDYQTRFVLPCYEEKGHAATIAPIDRDEFIATWPFQNWGPYPSDIEIGTVAYDQLNLMCPAVPDEWD
ncbi:hypothetical protein ABIE21_001588 [Conyzicola nivalis]|uniref:Uncharacterized protein n=1 Tax=Conyzicola nivalis TaxID=1477021 RepID=A0ABV2QM18_9MICO